jgi:DNA mismatch repair protein MutH
MVYNSIEEIINKSIQLIGKSLNQIFSTEKLKHISAQYLNNDTRRKGRLGEIVEKEFFEINPGIASIPDFEKFGIELKVTPLKITKTGLSAKERLVLSMIDYLDIIKEEFKHSKFLKKNNNLLIIFYLYEKDKSVLDYKFLFVYLLDLLNGLNPEDIKIIENDWNKIKEMVLNGKAHLLSEKQTKILGACTKSSTNKTRRPQPRSKVNAKPRAYSIKGSFITKIIREKTQNIKDEKFFTK